MLAKKLLSLCIMAVASLLGLFGVSAFLGLFFTLFDGDDHVAWYERFIVLGVMACVGLLMIYAAWKLLRKGIDLSQQSEGDSRSQSRFLHVSGGLVTIFLGMVIILELKKLPLELLFRPLLAIIGNLLAAFDTIPSLLTWGFFIALGLHVLAWGVAMRIGFRRSRWLCFLMCVPFLYPFCLIDMGLKRHKPVMLPFCIHLLAILAWYGGGFLAKSTEVTSLEARIEALGEQGESLNIATLYPSEPTAPENNIWDHPYLVMLARAGQSDTEGEGQRARELMDAQYEALELPKCPGASFEYEYPEGQGVPIYRSLERLHSLALCLDFEASPAADSADPPASIETLLEQLAPLFTSTGPDLEQLREALDRPEDVYPFDWKEGPGMLLPQLSKLKMFSIYACLSATHHAYRGNGDASYQDCRLALRLAETGHWDGMIIRLVQAAQVSYLMVGIQAAQDRHSWSEAQWNAMLASLETFNMVQHAPEILRKERALLFPWLKAGINGDPFETLSMLYLLQSGAGTLDGSGLSPLPQVYRWLAGPHLQAWYTRQLSLMLEALSQRIAQWDDLVQQADKHPWSRFLPAAFDESQEQDGLLARMWLSSMGSGFRRLFRTQVIMEICSVSMHLERYYLHHQAYPTKLEDLVPAWIPEIPLDPMTQAPFKYKRLEGDGFEIYSVGWNGRDDQGISSKSGGYFLEGLPDDLLWRVEGASVKLPVMKETIDEPKIDIEMMKRYGLLPMGDEEDPVIPEKQAQ